MKLKLWIYILAAILLLAFAAFWAFKTFTHRDFKIGQKVDSLNGVYVYYNGSTGNISGRSKTADGYNLGLKYQCVEFVKRYYYEYLNHKMPDAYGDAKDFFDKSLDDGQKNKKRDLIQYTNPGKTKPQVNDLLVFDGTLTNQYGHVAIISAVSDDEIEIIQQNPGPHSDSRGSFSLRFSEGKWEIKNKRVLGWLRKE